MSGEDDRGEAKPGKNAVVDDAPPPAARRRKAKPPPNIITAGGVDMARGHATGIQIREAAPEPPTEPRVVVAVETDPRKVPTHRRLLEGREPTADGARPAMLPGGTVNASSPRTPTSTAAAKIDPGHDAGSRPQTPAPASRPEPAPASRATPEAEPKPLPVWMRVAFAAFLLLLLVGVIAQFRAAPSAATMGGLRPPETTIEGPKPGEAMMEPLPSAAPLPGASADQNLGTAPTASTAPAGSSAPSASATATPRVIRTPSPHSPPKATFTPPFQLPSEKN